MFLGTFAATSAPWAANQPKNGRSKIEPSYFIAINYSQSKFETNDMTHATSKTNSRSRFWAMLTIWLVAAFALALVCQTASAQTMQELNQKYQIVNEAWRVIPLRPGASADEKKNHRAKYKKQQRLISADDKKADQVLAAGSIQAARPFFEGYVFPMMRVNDEVVISKLGQRRTDFLKNYLNSKVKGGARSELIDLTISNMETIYQDEAAHRASRLSAVYLIGMLDSVSANRIEGTAPVPSSNAFSKLGQLMNNANTPPFLRVAAMAGIHRHAQIDKGSAGGRIPANQKQIILGKCREFLASKETDDLTYWLKRRSMQMIGLMGDANYIDSALTTLESKEAGLWLQLDAVDAIGKLTKNSSDATKNLQACRAVTQFAADAMKNEVDTIKGSVDHLVNSNIIHQNIDLQTKPADYQSGEAAKTGAAASGGGGGMGGGRGGMGGGMGGGLGGGGLGDGPGGGMGGGMGSMMAGGKEPPGVELPGYQLNLIRRRIKSIGFLSLEAMGRKFDDDQIKKELSEKGKAFAAKIGDEMKELISNSNVGIVDLEKKDSGSLMKPGDKPPGTATKQLTELCDATAERLLDHIADLDGVKRMKKKMDDAMGAPGKADPLGGAAPAKNDPLGGSNSK